MTDTSTAGTQAGEAKTSDLRFALAVACVFCAVAAVNSYRHVMWRDESRCWMIVMGSPTFADLRANLQGEGVPYLWYLMIWPLTWITTNSLAMKSLHVLVASGTVFLFTWRAPFSRTMRLLFPLGYYALFEYATITRNYAIVFLGIVAAAAVISAPRRRPWLLGLVLLLMTQTSIWGAGVAAMLYLSAALDWTILAPRERRVAGPTTLALGVFVAAGMLLCYYCSLPAPGASFLVQWPDDMSQFNRFMTSVGGILRSWVPISLLKRTWWGSNIFDFSNVVRFIVACVVFTTALLLFLRRPPALVPLLLGTIGLVGFHTLRFPASFRHDGYYFMLLIFAFWLGSASTTPPIAIPWPWLARINSFVESQRGALLALLLTLQAVAGVEATILDHLLTFSSQQAAAEHIRREFPDDSLLIGYDDRGTQSVGFFLDRPIHSVQTDLVSRFANQTEVTRRPRSIEALFEHVERLHTEHGRDVIIALCPDGEADFTAWTAKHPESATSWEWVGHFPGSTVPNETTTLYVRRR